MTTTFDAAKRNGMDTNHSAAYEDQTDSLRIRRNEPRDDLRPALRAVAVIARPRVGWALAVLGVIALLVAWAGVSGEIFVSRQMPYVVSGGLGGIALIVLAGVLLGTHDLYGYARRLDVLEQKVDDIHRVIVMAWEDRAGATIDDGRAAGDGLLVAALPKGASYHRLDCVAVQGKAADQMPAQQAVRLGLSSCKLCEPPLVPVTPLPA